MHRADPSTLVTSLFAGWRENKDEKRAARRARQSHSRERWLGTNPRTVGAARRRFLSRFAKDPDRAFDVVVSIRLSHHIPDLPTTSSRSG